MNRWLSPIAAINADIEALFMSRSSRSLLFSYYLVCFVRVLGKETGTGADNCPGTPTRGGGASSQDALSAKVVSAAVHRRHIVVRVVSVLTAPPSTTRAASRYP